MKATSLLVVCCVAGDLAVAVTRAQTQAQTPVFRSGTDAVLVDVSVRSGNRAVTGLGDADFELRDNGVPQTLDSTSLESVPIDVTLLLDTSASTDGTLLERLKRGVRDSAQLLRSDDRLRVIAVQHVLSEIVPLQPAGRPVALDRLVAQGGTALYDGLGAAMMRATTAGRRQLIVAYTDGDDASSISSPDQTLEIALRADGVLHVVVPVEGYRNNRNRPGAPVGVGSRPTGSGVGQTLDRIRTFASTSDAPLFPNETTLRAAADHTGGRVFVIDMDDSISDAFRSVLEDYRTSYLLRYVPEGVKREGWHEISVRVKKPGAYNVRARKGWGG